MYLTIGSLIIIFLLESAVKVFNKSMATDIHKMKILRAVELIFLSPFIVTGLILFRGRDISDNKGIIIGVSAIMMLFALRSINIQLKNMKKNL